MIHLRIAAILLALAFKLHSYPTMTSLSAMDQAPPDDFMMETDGDEWLDAFEFDEDDFADIDEIFEDLELEEDVLEDLAFDDMAVMDLIFGKADNAFNQDKAMEPVEYKDMPHGAIPAGRKTIEEYAPLEEATDANRIIIEGGKVFLDGDTTRVEIGRCKLDISLCLEITEYDHFERADKYSEEVGGRGSNGGFSMYVHLAAVMVFANVPTAVVEPVGGSDCQLYGLDIEVTGRNYRNRESTADIIVSKYPLLQTLRSTSDHKKDFLLYAWKEDVGTPDYAFDTGFDTDTSNRSPIIRDISRLISQCTDMQYEQLAACYKSYCSREPVIHEDAIRRVNIDDKLSGEIMAAIIGGSKERDGRNYIPSPFRVSYPEDSPAELSESEIIKRTTLYVRTSDWVPDTTYHTFDVNADTRPALLSTTQFAKDMKDEEYNTFHDAFYRTQLKYRSIAQIEIQSVLLPKIHGKGGCFYDKYIQIGLSWFRNNASSLTWNVMYYMFDKPASEELVGRWGFNEALGIYTSPVFKVSRQDVHYATILPAKVSGVFAACRSLMTPSDFSKILPNIIVVVGHLSNSTWMTSKRSGANRFITTCHMSESGDLNALIRGQIDGLKKHRFPDASIMKLMYFYTQERVSSSVTPLFRLPLPLMSLEKDFSQMLQWHMRDTDHDTKAMVKVTEAAKRHADEEISTYDWLTFQRDWLEQMLDGGKSQHQFDALMRRAPQFPTLNVPMFMAMSKISCQNSTTFTKIHHNLGFSIWSLITDRHCIAFNGQTTNGVPRLKTTKVVDAFPRAIQQYLPVSGPYELLVKIMRGSKIPKNYLLNHAKDAKESDREISQMHPLSRIKQSFPEMLAEAYTGSSPVDQMSDVRKYSLHVEDTIKAHREGKPVHVSEDRSKFCQEQDPQLQGLCLQSVSRCAGSTQLVAAAAFTMTNVIRYIVYPKKADTKELLSDLPSGDAILDDKGKVTVNKMIAIEKNMTQGLGAITAGAINTVFVDAQDRIADELLKSVTPVSHRTTSDDVKASAAILEYANYLSNAANYACMRNRHIHMCMMLENLKKLMVSSNMSEFNNVVATLTGMIPQSPIFATLAVQPLLSKSIFGDIVTVVNSTRSTLTWGCPPDVVEATFNSMLKSLRQKWLLTTDEMDVIWRTGLLPRDMSEHIEGFWIRDDRLLRTVVAAMDDEQKVDVLSGRVQLFDMLKRIELDVTKKNNKKKKRQKPLYMPGLHRANQVARTVMSQRYVAERLLSRHIQPIPHLERIRVKNKFMQVLAEDHHTVDISEFEKLAPAKVSVHVGPARYRDFMPQTVGVHSSIKDISVRRIRCKRHLGVHTGKPCTPEEERIALMTDEEYDKQIALLDKRKRDLGFAYKSPGGLPLVRSFDGTLYRRPATFNFTVHIEPESKQQQPFSFRGLKTENFKPIIWGSAAASRFTAKRYCIAFATAVVEGEDVALYRVRGKTTRIEAVRMTDNSRGVCKEREMGLTIYYLKNPDVSPLRQFHHRHDMSPSVPGITGSSDALMNYGFYCRCSTAQGVSVYANFYRVNNSVLPPFVIDHLPPYPKFLKSAIEVPMGKHNVLIGDNCISKLKLVPCDKPDNVVTVDLTGDVPLVVEDAEEEIVEVEHDDFFD